MKPSAIYLPILFTLIMQPAFANAGKWQISNTAHTDTLPELPIGVERRIFKDNVKKAVTFFTNGGFENDPYRLIFPADFQSALDTLHKTQYAATAEEFIQKLNQCAAKLAQYIAPDFIMAANHFKPIDTIDFNGNRTDFCTQLKIFAQHYLSATAFAYERHLLESTGTLAAYRKLAGTYNGIFYVRNKLNFSLEGFLSGQVVERLFKFSCSF